ncbi:hypothetical protein PVAP13_2KG179158 [Panicum virgatum]|uniref:Uncharacterized protein n=1 Tax=Panicum virgatum TaxID=38727 RepID=A0A8T0VZ17_PANVG|nr:hypothetical protein PVAP13_2KG179158 [Panicum virgatum]
MGNGSGPRQRARRAPPRRTSRFVAGTESSGAEVNQSWACVGVASGLLLVLRAGSLLHCTSRMWRLVSSTPSRGGVGQQWREVSIHVLPWHEQGGASCPQAGRW